ncbi:Uu.00g104350.m01.CDS01 [Anthostomella pinea]|uniref:Uu.00g104350.m01.CDS01 n=1 Tax=Anthostomella pinea TaxID=933095 RepID=A0AAI8YDA0_9PEZI|nr:Uu.00g104350.m01.CDS01 [Anthostomella pinea]
MRQNMKAIEFTEKNHAVAADGEVVVPPQHNSLPKFFAKNGFAGADPTKIKKNGGGKGNWGEPGEEIVDMPDFNYNFTHSRRRSNSSGGFSSHLDMRSKFEVNDVEPVFEETLHGPTGEDDDHLTKTDTASSSGSSVDEKDHKNI